METGYIISLDQGTTSSRVVVFDLEGNIVTIEQKEFNQIFPQPGWVEHDPLEIYASQYSVLIEAVAQSGIQPKNIKAIGITNQRETTIVWDKNTGKPVYNAIVWQCRRTSDYVEKLKKDKEINDYITETTGLIPDAYYSATKIKWILNNVEGAREKAERGELLFGTVDTWLMWKLTNGETFATDYTNASRTMLFDIKNLCWDKKLCDYFGIPMSMLPEVKPSSGYFGKVNIFGVEVPIASVAGDQQSALFGQCCFDEGEVKNTYGTGCFLLMNAGDRFCRSENGLVTTLNAQTYDGHPSYALEGSVFVGGALVQWLRDQMRFIVDAADSEYFAKKAKTNNGVYIVPAFTGLGAPYWDMYARGTIFGVTRGTTRENIIRAALESIAYQSEDLVDAMEKDTGIDIKELKVDGGASANGFLMQFQSDISNVEVIRAANKETTSLGVFYLAGLAIGVFTWDDIKDLNHTAGTFNPQMDEEERNKLLRKWHKAVRMCRGWEDDSAE